MKNIPKQKIIVGMSGGIDSSMTAFLLKKQSWQPIGVSLNLPQWHGKKNFASAKKICQRLNIPYYLIDCQKDFKDKVVDYFIKELKKGQTPNPCVVCNRYLKFAKLIEFAQTKKINYVATGHYARKREFPIFRPKDDQPWAGNFQFPIYQLLTAKDKTKDQTYNLCFLTQEQLQHLIFPLGNYTKKEVYQMAKKQGFNWLIKQKQSQDFCYVNDKLLTEFLTKKLGKQIGNIVDEKGNILGQHKGLHFYTIGQRKGLRINNGPWFVKTINKKKNILIVTKNEKEIVQKEIYLSPFNFLSGKLTNKPIKVMAKIRYRQPLNEAILSPTKNNQLKLVFKNPQKAATPGQFCVFYQKNICLGGGKIINNP